MKIIPIVIVAALVFGGLVYFTSTNAETDGEMAIYYDDYLTFSEFEKDPAAAAGTLSLTSIQGIPYVHANDVGEGKIIYSDGSEQVFDVQKANLDIYMIAGQSNAEYRPNYTDPSKIDVKLGTAYYYGTPTRPAGISQDANTYEIHSMVNLNTGVSIVGGLDAPLAAGIVELTGHKVLTINVAVGGSSILTWLPGATNYLRAQNLVDDALSQIDRDKFVTTVKDYVWIQGEADDYMSVSTYKANFLTVHSSFTTTNEFSSEPLQYALIVKVQAIQGQNASIAHQQLPAMSDTILLASTITDTFTVENQLLGPDGLHYTQAGHILVANEILETIGEMRL